MRARLDAACQLQAHQKSNNASHDRCCEAGAVFQSYSASGSRPHHVLSGSEDALGLINVAPITGIEGHPLGIHGPYGQNGGQGRRNMKASATVVPRRGDDELSFVIAETHGIDQDRIGFADITQFPATDVDNLSSCFYRLIDSPSQVHLGCRSLIVV